VEVSKKYVKNKDLDIIIFKSQLEYLIKIFYSGLMLLLFRSNPLKELIMEAADKQREKDEEVGRQKILNRLKELKNRPGQEFAEEIDRRRTNNSFTLDRLMKDGEVRKVMEKGHLKAFFRTLSVEKVYEIDNDTDLVTSSPLTGNSRRLLRYTCAALINYSVKDQIFDMSEKDWRDVEAHLLKRPGILINELIRLHAEYEREESGLFKKEEIKNL